MHSKQIFMKRRTLPDATWPCRILAAAVVGIFVFIFLIPCSAKSAVFNIAAGDVDGLIAAIDQANSNHEANTINLTFSTYTLRTAVWQAVDNECDAAGLPIINGNILIEGNGATIERAGFPRGPYFRIFFVSRAGGELILRNLTVRNGAVCGSGGGIFNMGQLTLFSTAVTGNSSSEGGGGLVNGDGATLTVLNSIIRGNETLTDSSNIYGGGVYNAGGAVVLRNSIVEQNRAIGGFGGGIGSVFGKITIENSTVRNNLSWQHGGGIYNNSSQTRLVNTTIQGNRADDDGGGIWNNDTIEILSSTISGNFVGGGNVGRDGGGISNNSFGIVKLTNSTITGNEVEGFGGGIRNDGDVVELANTIVAANTLSRISGHPLDNCRGAMTSRGHNIEDGSTCGLNGPGDKPNRDPKLGIFVGLDTPGWGYFPLLPGSPAVDAANNSSCTATDQLGAPRSGNCDIGAVEYHSPEWLDGEWVVDLDIPPNRQGGAVTGRAFGTLAGEGEKTNLADDGALLRAVSSVEDEVGNISDAIQTVSAKRRFRLSGFHRWSVYLSGILRGILQSDTSLQGSPPFAIVEASADVSSKGVSILHVDFGKSLSNGGDAAVGSMVADVDFLDPGDYELNVTLRTEAFVPGRLSPISHNTAHADFFAPIRGWDVGLSVVEYFSIVNDLVTLDSSFGRFNQVGSSKYYRIDANFTNNSSFNVCDGGFQILELQTTSGTQLQVYNANGDGPFGGVGAFVPFSQVVLPSEDMLDLLKGQSAGFAFIIPVPDREAIRFFVNMAGEPTIADCP